MTVNWTEEAQRACTTGRSVCAVPGCRRDIYGRGLCSDHWDSVPDPTCEHESRVLVLCGRCGRRCCQACYGPWNALACERCRAEAS